LSENCVLASFLELYHCVGKDLKRCQHKPHMELTSTLPQYEFPVTVVAGEPFLLLPYTFTLFSYNAMLPYDTKRSLFDRNQSTRSSSSLALRFLSIDWSGGHKLSSSIDPL
jgi:hypothetical protein